MRKFGILVKKELKELLTVSSLIPIILIMAIFYFLGNFIGGEIENEVNALENLRFALCDRDNSELSREVADDLAAAGCDAVRVGDASEFEKDGLGFGIEIPNGFEQSILSGTPAKIKLYAGFESSSMTSSVDSAAMTAVGELINAIVSEKLMSLSLPQSDMSFLTNPVRTDEYTVFNGNVANVSAAEVQGKMMLQTLFLPIVLYLVIMLASQMLANSVANEKTDKTLETLLSAPVGRISILSAKMLAAGIVSLIYSVFYIIGYSWLMDGMYAPIGADGGVSEAMSILGLEFGVGVYALFGLQLFLSILCALALSLIIGILAADVKKVQSMIMPLMLVVMIPYFISLVSDILTFDTLPKLLIGAIPFTHSFTAVNAVMFGQMGWYWAGAAYQAIFVAVLMVAALKIIRSDAIFTFGGRPTAKKKKSLAFGRKV